MTTMLIKNADVLATMDAEKREIADGALLVRDGVIVAVGPEATNAEDADEIIDASGCVVTPGLVNTHHHLFQSLTRATPAAQDARLFGWLRALYPVWARMTPDDIRLSTQVGLAELALSGCATSADHLYLFPNGARLDDSLEAAATVGLRLHATRGSMSIGESGGGLPPDALVEREDAILKDCDRLIDAFHDPSDGAMVQIAVAPCSPFSVSRDLMRESAALARAKGVMLHTHLAENDEDVAFSLERFGYRPGAYVEELGWTGPDVWHAHCVKLDQREIDLFARTQTGVAHCPCSNGRLGSGVAPVRALRDAGVRVGLGVDGSASNDAAHLLSEARQALLFQRVVNGADAMSAREALEIATRGGAETLGRADIGRLEVGKRADIAIWPRAPLTTSGAWDPVAALVLTAPHVVRDLFVEGRAVVRDGRLVTVDAPRLHEAATAAAARLAEG